MRLSTKSRFAVTAMIDMGLREQFGPVALAAISQRQRISISYLEQIFSKLRLHGLVDSTRGPGGGYTFTRDAKQISVADIINAVNSEATEHDQMAQAAEHHGYVSTDELWSTLHQKIEDHMQAISLDELIHAQRSKGHDVADRPSIQRGIYAQKTATAVKTSTPNSVFALAGALASSH